MFTFTTGNFLKEFVKFSHEILSACKQALNTSQIDKKNTQMEQSGSFKIQNYLQKTNSKLSTLGY